MVKTSEMSMELKQELAFTKEELAELEAAKKMPITFDADCPETTPERAVKFRRVNPPRNRMDAHGACCDAEVCNPESEIHFHIAETADGGRHL